MLFPVRICFTVRSNTAQRQIAIDSKLYLDSGDKWSVQAVDSVKQWLENQEQYELISVDKVLLKDGEAWITIPYDEVLA